MAVLMLVAIAGAGCAAATVKWEKPGVSTADQQHDETDCTSRASLESTVPSAQRMSTTVSTPIDPQSTRVEPYDPAVFEECMRTRGYERVAPTPK
jgi:hypothetical protein